MSNTIIERLAALRAKMGERDIQAFIIPGTDPHLSEYSAEHWKSRDWISGFTGSAGTAVVTTNRAGLWTDSRYFLQAEIELTGSSFELFKQGLPETPDIVSWLISVLPAGANVAIDGAMFSTDEALKLQSALQKKNLQLIADFDPFGQIWASRPAIPQNPLFIYEEKYSGESTQSKTQKILAGIQEKGASAILLSALDEIAWAFNVRGTDVECNPVVICYAYISATQKVLFIDAAKVPQKEKACLAEQGIETAPYDSIFSFIAQIPHDTTLLVDSGKMNFKLYQAISQHNGYVMGSSPVAWLKSLKNATEIAGFRNAMIKDGVALVQFFRWLEAHVKEGKITETEIGRQLIHFRSQQPLFVGESFSTISGYNEHGAIVHYHATEESESTLQPSGFLLIDSGGQYLDGTTDITRTIALGPLTERQKRDYTLVLKGHIAIATCRFPQGTRGAQIDVLARKPLWDYGMGYLHGTGHGIGHFLNVHEGPQNIRLEENPTPLTPGMVTSNEPGVYITGEYGIRTENLVLTTLDEKTDFAEFYKFETLTLCPIDKAGIDTSLLTDAEITWLNNYHQMVFEKLSPELSEEETEWLKQATAPISR